MGAFSVLAIVCLSVGIASACDFETLVTECTPPTATEESAFCGQYATYKECATDAGCLNVKSVVFTTQVVESGRYRAACGGGSSAPRSKAPRVTTSGGNVYLNGKQVCFSEEGATTVCASELALQSQVDDVLIKQGLLATDLEETRNEIVEIVKTTLTPLEAELGAANELIESIQQELDGHCGRHCYPGQYVKTPCTETTKTACAACTDGTFSPGGLNRFCPKCKVCNPRQFKTTDCNLQKDTGCVACTVCPDGKFAPLKDGKACADKSTNHCAAHAVCADKQFTQKVGNPWDNTVCVDCAVCEDGKFTTKACAAKSNTVCKACKKCGNSQVQSAECSATKDTVCLDKQKSCRALQSTGVEKDGMYLLTIGWTYCILNKKIGGGAWQLVMNIHPNDGHSAAWAAKLKGFKPGGKNYVDQNKPTFWAGDIQYSPKGPEKVPFGADYSSKANKGFKAEELMVVRHKNQKGDKLSNEDGQEFMWRRWAFNSDWTGKTMLYMFRNTYRTKVTGGVVETATLGNSAKNCPVFRYGGAVYFNFYQSNNGARLILDGQSLNHENQDHDSSFGLGMDFATHSGNKRFSGSNGDWCFDAAYAESPGGHSNAQGNDSCNQLYRNNDYLGEYAIFVR